jgi:hypothetical protein
MEYFWGKVHLYKRTNNLPDGLPSVHLKLRKEDYFDIEILRDNKVRPTIKYKGNRYDIPLMPSLLHFLCEEHKGKTLHPILQYQSL